MLHYSVWLAGFGVLEDHHAAPIAVQAPSLPMRHNSSRGSLVGMPLSWMLGAMTFTGFATILKIPIKGSMLARASMSAVVGTMLGSQIGPDTLESAVEWWPAIVALVLYFFVAATLSNPYLRHVVSLDSPTVFYSAMPGGLIDMILMGSD